TEGIHFHMFLNAQISYVAADRQRNVIPYVECKYPDGRTEIYKSTESPMTDEAVAKAKKLTVDCIECHNRPTHIYHNPATSLNLAMSQNWIDPTLPEIKRLGVEVLEKEYKTEQEATSAIASSVTGFYREKYATVASAKSKDIQTAVTQLQGIYKRNYFPEMKVSWKGHPDHIGHMYSPGCFRCHDGKHVNSKGKVLSRDCNTCHTIVAQRGADGKLEQNMSGLPFKHPVDIGTAWQDTNCSDCHAPQ
ncbi:MAG: cytochrome C, partial [Armatimonadetes bacterium]|nr:cytochrome C [Armatimonadota bacterium]